MTGIRVAIAMALGAVLSAAAARAQALDGQALYRQNCRVCHGTAGKPSPQMMATYKKMPTLSDPAFLGVRSDDSLVAVLKNGSGKDMKSFKGKLSPEEMAAIVKYVRDLATSKTP
jgi:mono/diheme cytochrome c family protein